jgi:hypothetical protein
MAKRHTHHLWDIEHELSNMQRLLDVWSQEIPAPLRKEFAKLIASIETSIRRQRQSALKFAVEVSYPAPVAAGQKADDPTSGIS